jgi:uncharacterized protein
MQFQGSVIIDAPRRQVWQFLTDPHAVGQCAPGLQSLEIITPDEKFRALVAVGFGSMKVKFTTDVEWVALDPPSHATMKAHGSTPGSAVDAASVMDLVEIDDAQTELRWQADITIHGAIASLAARLMGSVTQKLTGAFFDCVKQKIEDGGDEGR